MMYTQQIVLPDYETVAKNTLLKIPEQTLIEQHKKCSNRQTEFCDVVRSVVLQRMFSNDIDKYNAWRKLK